MHELDVLVGQFARLHIECIQSIILGVTDQAESNAIASAQGFVCRIID
ncbi:hypothetical protein [Rhizobium sp. GCM10022189]